MSQNLHDGPQPSGPRPDMQQNAPVSSSGAKSSSHPGQAYSPPPSSQSAQSAASSIRVPWRLVGLGAVAAAGLMFGGWYGLSGGEVAAPTAVGARGQQGKAFSGAAVAAVVIWSEQV